jgi:hypothetical protein
MFAYTSTVRYSPEDESVIVDHVYCLECDDDIGSMTVKTLMAALGLRGQILCTDCRSKRCDFCGFLNTETEAGPHPLHPLLIARKCYWCKHSSYENPVQWYHTLTQAQPLPPCLSSSPYLKKFSGKTR